MAKAIAAFLLTFATGPIGPLCFGRYGLAAGLLAVNLTLILALGGAGMWLAWGCNAVAGAVLAGSVEP